MVSAWKFVEVTEKYHNQTTLWIKKGHVVLSNSNAMAAMMDIHGGFWARHNGKYRLILQVFPQ